MMTCITRFCRFAVILIFLLFINELVHIESLLAQINKKAHENEKITVIAPQEDQKYNKILKYDDSNKVENKISLRVIDISDPENPHEVGSFDVTDKEGGERNKRIEELYETLVYVSGSYAYVTHVNGVELIDISDPKNPHEVGFYRLQGAPLGVALIRVLGNYAYFFYSYHINQTTISRKLQVIDISNPKNPHKAGSYDIPEVGEIYVLGSYAYVISIDNVQVIDLSDPKNPHEVGSWSYNIQDGRKNKSLSGISVSGSYAYVTDIDNLRVIDISDPKNPHEVGSWSYDIQNGKENNRLSGFCVSGNYAYVTDIDDLRVIDISDPRNPREVGSYGSDHLLGTIIYTCVYVSRSYAYLEDWDEKLHIIDISDPKNPHEVGSLYIPLRHAKVCVSGSHAYLFYGGDNLNLIDIFDPKNPNIVKSYSITGDVAADIYISENYAYVISGTGVFDSTLSMVKYGDEHQKTNLNPEDILKEVKELEAQRLYDEAKIKYSEYLEAKKEKEGTKSISENAKNKHDDTSSDLSEIIDSELKKLAPGRILFNPPEEMKVGVKERIEVRISKMATENLSTGLKGRGVPKIDKIRVGTFMTSQLKGDNFSIKALSNDEQLVEKDAFTQWDWDIVPLKSGTQTLSLSVTVRIKVPNGGEEKKDYPVFDRKIKVRIRPIYSIVNFIKNYWQWIISTLIGSGIIGWIINKTIKSRKKP